MACTTTVNVNDNPAITPANLRVRAFYTETDAGHLFGPFSSKEEAERCVVILASRVGVVSALIEAIPVS